MGAHLHMNDTDCLCSSCWFVSMAAACISLVPTIKLNRNNIKQISTLYDE